MIVPFAKEIYGLQPLENSITDVCQSFEYVSDSLT